MEGRKREKERNFARDLAQHRDLHERSGPRGARRYVDTYVRRHRVWHEESPPGLVVADVQGNQWKLYLDVEK